MKIFLRERLQKECGCRILVPGLEESMDLLTQGCHVHRLAYEDKSTCIEVVPVLLASEHIFPELKRQDKVELLGALGRRIIGHAGDRHLVGQAYKPPADRLSYHIL